VKKTIASLLASGSMLWATSNAQASYSWDVQPGPDGTMRVQTSNGTFIVDIEGNHGWIGTEDEYEHRRITGALKNQGYHELHVQGQGDNEYQVVSDSKPQVSLGQTKLADIYTEIYFDAKPDKSLHRPAKPVDSEYVGAVWVQTDKSETQVKIVDEENRTSYSPHYCHNVPGNMRTCEFIVPRESLAHQSALLFASARNHPVVVPRTSLAQEHDKIILDKYKPVLQSRHALDDEDAATLKNLHELDGNIALSLPPLPPGVTEIKPRPKGCRDEPLVLTQDQFDAVTLGGSLDQLECILGVTTHYIPIGIGDPLYYWEMKGVGYAVFTVSRAEPHTVLEKHYSLNAGWLRW
jgi:hypothetical protein